MKTIEQHLKSLSPEVSELAFRNVENQGISHSLWRQKPDLKSAIGAAFDWDATPERTSFWFNVASNT